MSRPILLPSSLLEVVLAQTPATGGDLQRFRSGARIALSLETGKKVLETQPKKTSSASPPDTK
jgi:hypothetical protein